MSCDFIEKLVRKRKKRYASSRKWEGDKRAVQRRRRAEWVLDSVARSGAYHRVRTFSDLPNQMLGEEGLEPETMASGLYRASNWTSQLVASSSSGG